ncbi:MAG: PD-(D/E)XK nuclease family protein [Candidatus Kerfeldbacteria bacterium]|nr:PD-(D/E)XK nuclease family protein [Candidatus Kerfeldbacteria bacterium]
MFKASPFKLRMYEVCPQQYKFTYLDQLAADYRRPKPYLTMGAHVHYTLKDFYERLEPTQRTWPALEQLLRQRWRENRRGFKDASDEQRWGMKALQMLKLFILKNDVTTTPAMLEDYYDMLLTDQLKVLGRIDRVDHDAAGLHVIDYKTGQFDEAEVSDLQLITYAMIVHARTHQPVYRASYLFLATNQWYSIDVTEDLYQAAADEILERVEKIIQDNSFQPTPNRYCRHCDFIDICPRSAEIKTKLTNHEF